MNKRIKELAGQAGFDSELMEHNHNKGTPSIAHVFAELIVQECIDKIETYRIPVGNSAAGEMACEWTYAALEEIRDEIKDHFGLDHD